MSINLDQLKKSAKLPELNRPQHPPQPTQPTQPAPNPSSALERVAEFREQSAADVGGEVVLAQQAALANLESFEQSARNTAQAIAQRKALTIASFPALIDSYTTGYLRQIDDLKTQSQAGFTNSADLEQWVEAWTGTTLPAGHFCLPGKSGGAALPAAK